MSPEDFVERQVREPLEAEVKRLRSLLCPRCGGEGLVDVPDGYVHHHQADCPDCAGTGKKGGAP